MICHYYPEPQYFFYVPDLSLIYYAHLPAALLALMVGTFVLIRGRNYLANRLLFVITFSFALWNVINMISWTNIHSDFILFSWSFFGPLFGIIAIFSIYFTHAFIKKRDVGLTTKALFIAILAPLFLIAPTALSLTGFNIANCDAFGFESFWFELYYQIFLGTLAIAWILYILFSNYRKAQDGLKTQLVLMGTGIVLFLSSFFFTSYLASYLVTAGILPDSEIEIYGLFGMVVFLVYIGIIMVRFRSFHTGLLASQALVVALVVLIGSQFTFSASTTTLVLNSITLILTGIVGIILIRSVNREVEQRMRIQALAGELEKANKQQVVLIHFITHQIKGFLTKSRNIFAMALEGDLGPISDTMKPMLQAGLDSDTKGVQTVQEILNASNIKSGKVDYNMQPFDFKQLVEEVIATLKPNADTKGISLTADLGAVPVTVTGDHMQLTNAVKNLIDNSIKYTQKGTVSVSLHKEAALTRLVIKDTGVGITASDMKRLFTEGGHGENSRKINVESTGFGLYIVKNIVEAHKGKVWAESEGQGKGSRFIIELPA